MVSKVLRLPGRSLLDLANTLLLGVAFSVLAEHKVMAFVQRPKGPDVVGSFGVPRGEKVKSDLLDSASDMSHMLRGVIFENQLHI